MRAWFRYLFLLGLMLLTACGQAAPQAATLTSVPAGDVSPLPPTPGDLIVPTLPPPVDVQALATLPPPPGQVRFIHAAWDTPALNVYVGDLAVATNLGYAQSTDYTPIPAGDITLRIAPADASADAQPWLEAPISIQSDESRLLILTGSGNQLDLADYPETITPLNAGESAVEVIHAASSVPEITLRQGETNLAGPISFGQTALVPALSSGATTLEFRSGENLLLSLPLDLQERFNYILILTGHADTLQAVQLTTPAPGKTTARVINASSTVSPIDVYLDGKLLAANTGFGRASESQSLIAGQHTISVYPAGADVNATEPTASQSINLAADQTIALIPVGAADHLQIIVYPENLSRLPPGRARMVFLNTLPDVPIINLQTGGGPLPDISTLSYGQMPVETLLNEMSYDFVMSASGPTGKAVEAASNLQLKAGYRYLYLVTGRLDNNPILLSENLGVDSALTVSEESGLVETGFTAQARLINALAEPVSVNFLAGSAQLAEAIGYQQSSDFAALSQSHPTFRIQAGGQTVGSLDAALQPGARYTVLAYGPDASAANLLLIPDSGLIFDSNAPHLRLINASIEPDVQFGLGFSEPGVSPDPTATVNPASTAEPGLEEFRRSIPFGVQRLLNSVAGGSVSSVALLPVGQFDLLILDPNQNQLAAVIPAVNLNAGEHYDVIAYQAADSLAVSAFLIPYPTPPD